MQTNFFQNNKVYFIDIRKSENGINTPGIIDKINDACKKVLEKSLNIPNSNNALIKVHIGEGINNTHMLSELTMSSVDYLKKCGIKSIAFGDTTVAYSGVRGYKENPENDVTKYLELAKKHGFIQIPFVILDRPITSFDDFSFSKVHDIISLDDSRIRYKKIYASGGFLSSDIIINNAHLTGHLIAKNALCIKSIAMGLASYAGKIQLHQNLYPTINNEQCTLCKKCVESCPEAALSIGSSNTVQLEDAKCIGCGQCAAECPVNAIEMQSDGISNWDKGTDNLDIRMAEYAYGLLSKYKGKMFHIGHLYKITGMCDCMNTVQKPVCKDIGMVLGSNPFAVDFASCTLEGLMKKGDSTSWNIEAMFDIANKSKRYEVYDYVKNTFGIDYVPDVEKIEVI